MTKAQRKARAKRAGAVRRKANAVKAFLRKMNPGKKAPVAVRVKRLKGGGISVTPLKVNAAKGNFKTTVFRGAKAAEYAAQHGLKLSKGGTIRVPIAMKRVWSRVGNIAW